MRNESIGQIYIIALPIGNPEDISQRARKTINTVDIVAAEDTRVFKTLCLKLNLRPQKIVSYHEHNEIKLSKKLISQVKEGLQIALVSDAGTPQISDPGYRLVRLAHEETIPLHVIPGPSSLSACLSLSPFGGSKHVFLSFLPHKNSERTHLLKKYINSNMQIIFFETPHQLIQTLDEIILLYGNNKELFICRELTKPHEETLFGPVQKLKSHFMNHSPQGEFTLIIAPQQEKPILSNKTLESKIQKAIQSGSSIKNILLTLKKETNMTRKALYQKILSIKKKN